MSFEALLAASLLPALADQRLYKAKMSRNAIVSASSALADVGTRLR